MIKVLLVGAGTMGEVHAEAYMKMKDAEVIGVADWSEDRRRELAAKLGAAPFKELSEALASLEEVDIVDICLATDKHGDAVKISADYGAAVICEKPLARSLEEAEELITYCENKRTTLFVGHVLRFFHEYVSIKDRLDNGEIGMPGVVRTFRGGAFPEGMNNWYADVEKSGGLILDMIIHDFDFLRWCFGEVERVYARSLTDRLKDKMDYALVTLKFKNGILAHVEGSWAHEGFNTAFEAAGKEGIIDFDSSRDKSLILQQKCVTKNGGGVEVPASAVEDSPYYLELRHFLDCFQTGAEPIVNARDAAEAIRISLAALESARQKKPVYIGEELK
ncbi:Gfo/Idh/MocA family protein [Alteribacillus sp. HJP-4]|uniref:Gfo/Idh/MocA family protein n=1 Tax=Alteribacillus sp. HJP-4 TaxID=2775394 RepID=UPI0035CCCEF3